MAKKKVVCKFGKLKAPKGKRVCKKKGKASRAGKKKGSGCRDKKGKFVPVPGCTGKRKSARKR